LHQPPESKRASPPESAPADAGIRGRLQLDKDGAPFLGTRRIDLLNAIAREGSITRAARSVGLSYKAAWDAIDAMNSRAQTALVTTAIGGSGGGGAQLTDYGRKVVQLVARVEAQYAETVQILNDPTHDVMAYQRLVQRFSLRTSARNQWLGTIVRVEQGLVRARATIALGASLELSAALSSESVRELELAPGNEVWALVKATAVVLDASAGSAKHAVTRWPAVVTSVQAEATHWSVEAELADGRSVCAILKNAHASQLAPRARAAVTVVIPESSVTLVVAP
jgi:molybdate transport system regulatory protein